VRERARLVIGADGRRSMMSDHDAWARAFFDLELSTFRAYAEGRQPPSPAALMARWLSRIDGEQVTD
jgi:2-polyprenyl-6-methoxyphenol hydroxylase-like FAD-dependent oxidoreductase